MLGYGCSKKRKDGMPKKHGPKTERERERERERAMSEIKIISVKG